MTTDRAKLTTVGKLIALLRQLLTPGSGFFGEVSIKAQNGKVQGVNVNRHMKPEDL